MSVRRTNLKSTKIINSLNNKRERLRRADSYISALRQFEKECRKLREGIDDLMLSNSKFNYYEREKLKQSMEAEAMRLVQCLYAEFVSNRRKLIKELRLIANESVRVKKACNVATVTSSSVGVAGSTVALIGAVLFPPLLLGGITTAGMGTACSLGIQLIEYKAFRKLLRKAEQLSDRDIQFAKTLEVVYEEIQLSNLINISDATTSRPLNNATNNLTSLGLQIGSGSTRVVAVGMRTVSVGSAALKGIVRGAVGLGILIDGVTIILSARDLAKGSSTKFAEALKALADLKERELEELCRRGIPAP